MINVSKNIRGKRILVTGGTGSFGKYITKTLLGLDPKEIIIFSRDEDKQYSMQFEYRDYKDKIRFFIGDVRDKESLLKATRGIDIIFHAAALKQIPSTENNVMEAIKTNSIGAQNLVDAAIANNVKKVIGISTDKAVEPVNAMGLTKALQEKIFISANKYIGSSQTRFSLVRYGNVAASRGSVIPLFKKQIDKGLPITITSVNMTRFILTLEQAMYLVFTALDQMKGGEIFIPKIRPLKIVELAQVMQDVLKSDNKKIKETGIRPGEKIHESLITPMESVKSIIRDKYYIILPQLEMDGVGYKYKISNRYDEKKSFRLISSEGPFITKAEIKNLLKDCELI